MDSMYLLSAWDEYFQVWDPRTITANKEIADKWESEGPIMTNPDYPVHGEHSVIELEVLA